MCLALYAASAYITNAVSKEMKNYVPMSVWSQWAQERGEWRGGVDIQIKVLKEEMAKLRQDALYQYSTLDKKQDVQAAVVSTRLDTIASLLTSMRDDFKAHVISNGSIKP